MVSPAAVTHRWLREREEHRACKARYTLVTKLNSARSTLLIVDKVVHVTLAAYTPATTSTVSAAVDFVAGFGNSRLRRQCVPGFTEVKCDHDDVLMCCRQLGDGT